MIAAGTERAHQCTAPLFVPANRPDRFVKAATSGADTIILDLEDAVQPSAKIMGRSHLRTDFAVQPIWVRINAQATRWHEEDIEIAAALPVTALMLPKAELMSAESLLGRGSRLPPIVALIETARGIADARQVALLPGVVRLAFGSIDYCADIGAGHVRAALQSARSELVLASRLAGLPAPIDGVTSNIRDLAEAGEDARHASDLGFGGKLCVHPTQIAPVIEGFAPSENEILWARRVIATQDGVALLDGAMVDAPVRHRARTILEKHDLACRSRSTRKDEYVRS